MTLSDYLVNPLQSVHYVLLGNPVSHSVSPNIHTAALRDSALPGDYFTVQVLPDEVHRIPELLQNPALMGVNITIPLKEVIISFLGNLDTEALESGAVNTLYRKNGQWVGTNTDIFGILSSLERWKDELNGKNALIFGTGGASKAAIIALKRMGIHRIRLVSRQTSHKESLSDFGNVETMSYTEWTSFADDTHLFVNSTPLGMWPACDHSPVSRDEAHLMTGKFCFDMVYRPMNTLFLQRAESVGAKTTGGLSMLLHQANASFEKWTGHTFSIDNRWEELAKRVNPSIEILTPAMGSSVKALCTLRNRHLYSGASHSGLDFGSQTGSSDDLKEFSWNTLHAQVSWTKPRAWVRQVHGRDVVITDTPGLAGEADALVTRTRNLALTIQVADCIPVLFADPEHQVIGAAHAGWRGVVASIVPRTLDMMKSLGADPASIRVWIGPGICTRHFEVGEEVASQFADVRVDRASEKPHVDLQGVIQDQLSASGIKSEQIQIAEGCSFSNADLFHSFRRDKEHSGRMVAMIALSDPT